MKIKVSELTGKMLDYWVARALGLPLSCDAIQSDYILIGTGDGDLEEFSPHDDWTDGGPIIERKKIELLHFGTAGINGNEWEAQIGRNTFYIDQRAGDEIGGPTPLIAAMRCVVVSEFGDEVDEL